MSRFSTDRRHKRFAGLLPAQERPAGHRQKPVVYRLPAEAPAVKAPPVRIFVGTEPFQHRAERVFLWSLNRVRNPAREYLVYLMKDLVGYSRNNWKTGFKTYRYAIPSLAGNQGRAIYNDVDQIYLDDPAELFDLDMQEYGVLCIDDRDSSVMLMDCARLADIWTQEKAYSTQQHKLFRRALQERGLWGPLPERWHARDGDYLPEKSALLHFTTLHKQPWHPFPEEFKYEANEVGEVWHSLEREADAAGFTPWSKERPSEHQLELYDLYRRMHAGDTGLRAGKKRKRKSVRKATFGGSSLAPHVEEVGRLVAQYSPASLLDYGSGKGLLYQDSPDHSPGSRFKLLAEWPGVLVTCYDPGYEPYAEAITGQFDGVISTDMLEHVPEEDVPWVLDSLFSHANKFLYLVAACFPARKHLADGQNAHCTVLPPEWWLGQVEAAARRWATCTPFAERSEPLAWRLCTREKSMFALQKRKSPFRPGIKTRYFRGTATPS